MEEPPRIIIHTLGNMMKGSEYINFKKSFNIVTKYAFALVGSTLYEIMAKYYHIELDKIEMLLATRDLTLFQGKYNASVMRTIENIPGILDTSSHPVHIVNKEGKLSLSSFIPFCQIGERYFGSKIDPFSFPVCDGFEKRIFEGQLCYYLNRSQLIKVEAGRKNSLKLFIDTNRERQSLLLTKKCHQAKQTKIIKRY